MASSAMSSLALFVPYVSTSVSSPCAWTLGKLDYPKTSQWQIPITTLVSLFFFLLRLSCIFFSNVHSNHTLLQKYSSRMNCFAFSDNILIKIRSPPMRPLNAIACLINFRCPRQDPHRSSKYENSIFFPEPLFTLAIATILVLQQKCTHAWKTFYSSHSRWCRNTRYVNAAHCFHRLSWWSVPNIFYSPFLLIFLVGFESLSNGNTW